MGFEIRAVADKIICEIIKHEAVSQGGIILPDSEHASVQPKKNFIVISVGDEITTVKVGEEILCNERAGMDHMMEGKIYKIVKYDEIYGVVKETK